MPDDSWSRLGQWSTAEGNYWEATVREELETAIHGNAADASLSPHQMDEVASAMALGLKDLWETTSRFPVPSEFEPSWMDADVPTEAEAPNCPSCSTAMAGLGDEHSGRWECASCGLVRMR